MYIEDSELHVKSLIIVKIFLMSWYSQSVALKRSLDLSLRNMQTVEE